MNKETAPENGRSSVPLDKIVMLNSDTSFDPEFPYAVNHGVKMNCPTCSAPGTKDDMKKHDNEAEFDDAIWWSTFDKHWECYDCWLK